MNGMFEWHCDECKASASLPDPAAIGRIADEHAKTHTPEPEKAPDFVLSHGGASAQRDPGPYAGPQSYSRPFGFVDCSAASKP